METALQPETYIKGRKKVLFWVFAFIEALYILDYFYYLIFQRNDAVLFTFQSPGIWGWAFFAMNIMEGIAIFLFGLNCIKRQYKYLLFILTAADVVPAILFLIHIFLNLPVSHGHFLNNIDVTIDLIDMLAFLVLFILPLADKQASIFFKIMSGVSILILIMIIPYFIFVLILSFLLHMSNNLRDALAYGYGLLLGLAEIAFFAALTFSKPRQPKAAELPIPVA